MRTYTILALLLVGVSITACADQGKDTPPGKAAVAAAVVKASVESIDYKTRHVTLKKEDGGELVTLKVGEAARNFDQLKKGDVVTFSYLEGVAIEVNKASGELDARAELSVDRSPLGSKPGGVISNTVTITALVKSIDYATRHITLQGPEGNVVTLKVGEEAKRFNEVKVGDHVTAQYIEALGISVSAPEAKAK